MPASEETGSGPVIHDHRRIDPVTGQVRGRHAASKPAGTTGAGRPAGPGSTGTCTGTADAPAADPAESAAGTADAASGPGEAENEDGAEEVLEGIVEDVPVIAAQKGSDAEARLAGRTAALQRLPAR